MADTIHLTAGQYTFMLLFLITDAASQTVTFSYNWTQQTSQCRDGGMIDGFNRIRYYGHVNATGVSRQTRLYFVFETRDASIPTSVFELDCAIDVDRDGCGHNLSEMSNCYCSNDFRKTYSLVYDKPAEILKSGYKIRLRWPANNAESKSLDMPIVHNMSDVSLHCTTRTPSNDCCPFDPKQSNTFTFCVSNLEHPKLIIEFDGAVKNTSHSACVSYSLKNIKGESDLIFYFYERTGCQRSNTLLCSSAESQDALTCWCPLENLPCPWGCILLIIIHGFIVIMSMLILLFLCCPNNIWTQYCPVNGTQKIRIQEANREDSGSEPKMQRATLDSTRGSSDPTRKSVTFLTPDEIPTVILTDSQTSGTTPHTGSVTPHSSVDQK